MRVRIARDGWPWIVTPLVVGGATGVVCQLTDRPILAAALYVLALVMSGFMFYFHRDPERVPPEGDGNFVAGADGLIRRVDYLVEKKFLHTDTVRVSVFLSPFDVHLNRAPMAGEITQLDYCPGRHLLTIQNASSEVNEHSSILIERDGARCLVRQIVGPIVRRVVYWLETGQGVAKGERIGMMRFGSRLDMYFPATDVEVLVKKGDRVRAGETVVARLVKDKDS